jgi:hypothetical protein
VGFAAPGAAWFSGFSGGIILIVDILSIFSVVLLFATSGFLLLSQKWRWSIIALSIQYLAVFWLVGLVWALSLSTVKLVVGWMSAAVLVTSDPGEDYIDKKFVGLPGLLFRLLAAIMIGMLVYSIAPLISNFLHTGMVMLWGGLILIGMGLLQLGMTTRISRVFLGLFTMLSGFEILYAVVERSILVTGLLAMINLGLAIAGSYLITAASIEEAP